VAVVNRYLRALLALAGTAAVLVATAPAAFGATTYAPNRFDDPLIGGTDCTPPAPPNSCSLRGAIAAASDGDTISLQAGTYQLVLSQLTITNSITIAGAGMRATTIKQTALFRIISSTASSLKITGLTLTGGHVVGANGPAGSSPGATGGTGGSATGSAVAFSNALTLTDVLVTANTAVGGNGGAGAPSAPGPGGNGGDGGFSSGAIDGGASLTMTRSEVSANLSVGGFGGKAADGSGSAVGGIGGASGDAEAAGIDMGISSTMTITDSLIAGNHAFPGVAGAGGKGGTSGGNGGAGGLGNEPTEGGGVFTNGHIDLTNVTITGNIAGASAGGPGGAALHAGSAGGAGGVSYGANGGAAGLLNGAVGRFDSVTIAGNTALAPIAPAPGGAGAGGGAAGATGTVFPSGGGGLDLYNSNSSLTLRDSIIAAGQAGDPTTLNCEITGGATFTSLGHNIDDGHSCLTVPAVGDHKDTPAGLQALADNGGPTRTMALAPGSAALGGVGGGCVQINGSTPLTHDQRGLPSASPCDIGAWQHQPVAITAGAAITVGGPGGATFTCQHAVAIGDGPLTHVVTWLRNGAPIAGALGDTYGVTDADRGQLVACQDHVSSPFGAANSLSAAVTVEIPTPPPGNGSTTTPRLTKLSVSPSSVRRGHRAHVKFTLSAAARVTFKLQRKTRGTKAGSKCVARKGTHHHGSSCTRLVGATGAPKAVSGKSGSNSVSWTPKKSLAVGSYVLSATPSHGKTVTKTFTIRR